MEAASMPDHAHGSRGALFQEQAQGYAAFRPTYPPSLLNRVYAFAATDGAARRCLAVDVACGTGQVAVSLAADYERVVALDSSARQLEHATRAPNIEYCEAPAEQLLRHVAPGSADLITVAQAYHWFDHAAFCEAARAALAPGGTLAIWGYLRCELAAVDPRRQAAAAEAEALVDKWCYGEGQDGPVAELGAYWDPGRLLLERGYAGLEPGPGQFRIVERAELTMDHNMTLDALLGYFGTFSNYNSYRKQHPDRPDPILPLRRELERLLGPAGSPEPVVRVSWPMTILLARDPHPPAPREGSSA
eukprot:scaffold28.g7595.t1